MGDQILAPSVVSNECSCENYLKAWLAALDCVSMIWGKLSDSLRRVNVEQCCVRFRPIHADQCADLGQCFLINWITGILRTEQGRRRE